MSKEALYYDQAEGLYARGHTLEQIAGIIPVSVPTLSRWKQKGGWEDKRRAIMAGSRNVAEILQEALEEKITSLRGSGVLDERAFDSIAKASAAIERLRRGAYDFRGAAVEVMERFTAWARREIQETEELRRLGEWIQGWFKSLE
jgi:hypothetical protein